MEVYVVCACGAIRGIRMMEVYGVYADRGSPILGGIRRYRLYVEVYADGGARGIRWLMYTGYTPVGNHHMRY